MIVGCPNCHLRYDLSHRDPKESVKCRCGASFLVPELPKIAEAWNCPNCGGGTNPEKSRCDFCGVYLAFASCPECFSPASRGSKYCLECGANLLSAAREDSEKDTELNCPHCNKTLINRRVNSYHMDLCIDCRGTWLDHEVLEQILNDKGKQKNSTAITGKNIDQVARKPDPDFNYRQCPYCQNLMHRRNFARKSGVIVDECIKHGVWFDQHELAQVIAYAQSVVDMPSLAEHYKPPEPEKPSKAAKKNFLVQEVARSGIEPAGSGVVDLAMEVGDLLSDFWSRIRR